MNFQPLLKSDACYLLVLFSYKPPAHSPLLRIQTMSFRSKQYITKSNGFSLPLSRVLGHPHIVVLRFDHAARRKSYLRLESLRHGPDDDLVDFYR